MRVQRYRDGKPLGSAESLPVKYRVTEVNKIFVL